MKNINRIVLYLLFLTPFPLIAQVKSDSWDKNYQEIDFKKTIEFENYYADSIESTTQAPQYYTRVEKYRFNAIYLGEKRSIEPSRLKSMKRVFKLYQGNPDQLDKLVKNEYKFKIGEFEFWFPMQVSLEKDFKKEVKKLKETKLYCLFLNEHVSKGQLYNLFLVSEFRTQY